MWRNKGKFIGQDAYVLFMMDEIHFYILLHGIHDHMVDNITLLVF